MSYQSPISPGRSWYEDTAGPRPEFEPLDGDMEVDVAIVGGGYTGLSAAAHLAAAGSERRAGRGAPARRRRLGPQWRAARHRAARLGRGTRGRARLDPRQGAVRPRRGSQGASPGIFRASTASTSTTCRARCRWRTRSATWPTTGRMPRSWRTASTILHISFMDAAETAERLGSTHYFGGVRDTGTGHIHPLKLVIGTARVAAARRRQALRADAWRRIVAPPAARCG